MLLLSFILFNMDDKQIELLNDVEEEGGSDCCGAKVYMDICSECSEHCGVDGEDDEDPVYEINKQESKIAFEILRD